MSNAKVAWEALDFIPGVHCHKPEGALYLFPRLDPKKLYKIKNDMDLCSCSSYEKKKYLLFQGTGFKWPTPESCSFCLFTTHRRTNTRHGNDFLLRFRDD